MRGATSSEIEPRIMAECQNGGDFLRIIMEEMCRENACTQGVFLPPANHIPNHLIYPPNVRSDSERLRWFPTHPPFAWLWRLR